MVSKDLGVRFTEEKYATKQEVGKDLGLSFVDSLWSTVLKYRSNFNQYISIRSVDNNKLMICLAPTIAENINSLDRKMINSLNNYHDLSDIDKESFKRNCYLDSLKEVSRLYQLDASDEYLRSIINGKVAIASTSNAILLSYFNALKYVSNAYVNNIDDSYLANIYSIITDTPELISFYRTSDIRTHANKVLIDRVYTSAPANAIEPMMDSLFEFIRNSSLSSSVKAIVAYYYINYIKPFPEYNDVIALLMAKSILCHEGGNDLPVYYNLEKLFNDNLDENAKKSQEVQKTNDITYFVIFGLTFFDRVIDSFIDLAVNFSVYTLKNDFFKEDEPKVEEIIEPKVEEIEVKEKVEEPQREVPPISSRPNYDSLAVNYIPPVLDEKEAYRLEQDLLESDPSLKRGEAYFYARHCTLNKFYTISMYKKELGCAYETARTSMENLVNLGYYRKDKIKNKFVYFPVKR